MAVPPQIRVLEAAWSTCGLNLAGWYDSPIALPKATTESGPSFATVAATATPAPQVSTSVVLSTSVPSTPASMSLYTTSKQPLDPEQQTNPSTTLMSSEAASENTPASIHSSVVTPASAGGLNPQQGPGRSTVPMSVGSVSTESPMPPANPTVLLANERPSSTQISSSAIGNVQSTTKPGSNALSASDEDPQAPATATTRSTDIVGIGSSFLGGNSPSTATYTNAGGIIALLLGAINSSGLGLANAEASSGTAMAGALVQYYSSQAGVAPQHSTFTGTVASASAMSGASSGTDSGYSELLALSPQVITMLQAGNSHVIMTSNPTSTGSSHDGVALAAGSSFVGISLKSGSRGLVEVAGTTIPAGGHALTVNSQTISVASNEVLLSGPKGRVRRHRRTLLSYPNQCPKWRLT